MALCLIIAYMNNYSNRPLIALTVAAIVERPQGYLIVDEWVHGMRLLNQPAGHVEPGESPQQAVIREVSEETGYAFTPTAILGLYHDNPASADGTRVLRIAYTGTVGSKPEHHNLDDGIIHAEFYSREALLQARARHRSHFVLSAIEDYERGQRFPLDLITFRQ